MELKGLKSGTDVRGTALPGYGSEVNLGAAEVRAIADAFCAWLRPRVKGKIVAVGGDSRLSTEDIKAIVTEALTDAGYDVKDCGLCSTPSMFMTTKFPEIGACAAVMVTASHHPSEKNGLKFFLPGGGLEGAQIGEIIELAERGEKLVGKENGKVEKDDFMRHYCDFLVAKVREATGETEPLKGMKIVVDAGNGAGAFYPKRVLEPLGADTTGSQFLEPDGNFPNHIPNPENPQAMESVSHATVNAKADLGVIFDTDVDRAAIVAPDGSEINRNSLIALISAILLRDEKGATIVTDSVTSDGLKTFIEEHGGKHHRFKRGYKNVIDEAIRLNEAGVNAPLAIETSGHAALRENYFLDDGAYLVTRIIIEAVRLKKAGKPLLSLIEDLHTAKESLEVRLSFNTPDWKNLGAFVIENMKKTKNRDLIVAPDNYEGVRVSVPKFKGWFLIRMSVHDPIMPINIESDLDGGAVKIAEILYAYLSAFGGLNCSNLEKIVK